MIVFLYGPDTFRSQKKLDKMIESQKVAHKKGGLLLRYFDGGNFDFKDLLSEIQTNSMFKEKKLLVLKNVFSNKKFKEDFLEHGKKITKSDAVILFHEQGEIDKRDRLLKFLKENAESQEFELLSEEKLATWADQEIKNCGAAIEPKALKKLITYVGDDLWHLENEIIKLVCHAKNKNIKEEDIDLLVRPKTENDIFETINSLAERKKDKALFLLHKHLEKGDSPLYLLSMINFQFRNLLVLRDLIDKKAPYHEIPKRSGLHPFVVKKTYWPAQKFSLLQLKKIYQKIFQIDLAIKTGKIDSGMALDLLIAGI
ncbi:MAG: DNA polymerase III subunit delta [Patescibacteria group bacterium]